MTEDTKEFLKCTSRILIGSLLLGICVGLLFLPTALIDYYIYGV